MLKGNKNFIKRHYKSALAMTTAAILCFAMPAMADAQTALGRNSSTVESQVTNLGSVSADEKMTIPEIVQDVMPCMVQITSKSVKEVFNMFGQTQEYETEGAGTGVIVGKNDDELLIATNAHVVSGTEELMITFSDGENNEAGSTADGVVKGIDSLNDLAIVAVKLDNIEDDTMDKINIIRLGNSDELQVGEEVVAIGNALGYGQSVSSGIISAKGRTMRDEDGNEHVMLQTDASINPGNSGGALLNMKGELIGINEAKYVDQSVEGVGYAIPLSIAEPILTDLGNRETREKVDAEDSSYLGVYVMAMPTQYIINGYPAGAYVQEVVEGLAADKGGLQAQDIITQLDGINITSSDDLVDLLSYYAAGEEVEVTVKRLKDTDELDFDEVKLTVTLGSKAAANVEEEEDVQEEKKNSREDDPSGLFERKDSKESKDADLSENNESTDENADKNDPQSLFADDEDELEEDEEKGYLDITCMTMPEEYVDNGYPAGAYISEITEDGAADQGGIRKKDIIVAVDGDEVESTGDLVSILADHKAGDTLSIDVMRLNDEKDFEKVTVDVTLSSREDKNEKDSKVTDRDDLGLFSESGIDQDALNNYFSGDDYSDDLFGDQQDLFDWFSQGYGFGGGSR